MSDAGACHCDICIAIARGHLQPVNCDSSQYVCPARASMLRETVRSHGPDQKKSEITVSSMLSHADPAVLDSVPTQRVGTSVPKPESSRVTDDMPAETDFSGEIYERRSQVRSHHEQGSDHYSPVTNQRPEQLSNSPAGTSHRNLSTTPERAGSSMDDFSPETRMQVNTVISPPRAPSVNWSDANDAPPSPCLFPPADAPIRIEIPKMEPSRPGDLRPQRRRQSIRWVCIQIWTLVLTFTIGFATGFGLGKI